MAMGDTPVTVVGNLVADPELKYTQSGTALARFTVASTPRSYDRESGQYKDGTAMFMRCSAWRGLAENIASSLAKGNRVVVTGRLRQHNWQTPEGENRSMLALEVDEIGPSLRFATAQPAKADNETKKTAPPADDPWNTTPAPAGGDEPPF
ncbi:single-stranded DNA-binding protein [Streptomyces sp. HPH0547]|uniref:Single-stranded DNA-binding protein n=1 Tax=Streptomyces albus TaxID=1888 RepID=A0A8H1LEI9_9ACTN|nr:MULTISPECIES: single-stranded DNA-binding protein [Streptomyces]EPD91415.1 single-stranded DNA-binding protein [Streptomyces sp. HPH0547]TGG81678.1 single-stranded DNA-binding protein [Streptomyces albus]UVN55663.1 single-stranded DNA-binding protein [Streptomyces albus]